MEEKRPLILRSAFPGEEPEPLPVKDKPAAPALEVRPEATENLPAVSGEVVPGRKHPRRPGSGAKRHPLPDPLPADWPMTSEGTPVRANKHGKPRGHGYKIKARKGRQLSIDRAMRAASMHVEGVPQSEIAIALNATPQLISKVLKGFEPVFRRLPEVERYRAVKGQLLSSSSHRLLESLNETDSINAAPLGHRAKAFEIVDKAERLERGQSTSNSANISAYMPKDSGAAKPEPVDVTPQQPERKE